MKMLLKCSLIVSAIALSSFAMAEDGFDQTSLGRSFIQPNESANVHSGRFAEMLERQPAAAGQQQERSDSKSGQHRSPERQQLRDSNER